MTTENFITNIKDMIIFCFNRLKTAGTGNQDPWGEEAFQYVFGKGRHYAYYANQIRLADVQLHTNTFRNESSW